MGLFPGGSIGVHDHSSIGNGGSLGAGTVDNPQLVALSVAIGNLRAATGSFLGADNGSEVTLNDYSFAPSMIDAAIGGTPISPIGSGTSNTVAKIRFNGNGANNIDLKWRYLTASDDPTIWIAYDPITGAIKGAWCSDDPTPNDVPGVTLSGMATLKLKAADLAGLTLANQAYLDAAALIAENGMKPAHLNYRALQLATGDPAPSSWIFNHCKIDTAMKTLVQTTTDALIATTEQAPMPEAKGLTFWQTLRSWIGW